MEKHIITEQDILNANASIPLVLKWTIAKYIAEFSIEKKTIAVTENGDKTIPLPDLYQRRTMMESQFKIGVFAKEYMRFEFAPVKDKADEQIPYLMAADEADSWSNFEAQLDRLKRSKDKTIADKCYDILNDYHAFVRMVSIEIEQELQIRNDLLGRAAWFLTSTVSETVSNEIKNTIDKLPKADEPVETPAGDQEAEADGA